MRRYCTTLAVLAGAACQVQAQRARVPPRALAVGIAMQGSDVSVEIARIAQAGVRRPLTGHVALAIAVEYARASKFSGIDVCLRAAPSPESPCLDPPETESVMSGAVSVRFHDVMTAGTRGHIGLGGMVSHTWAAPRAYSRRTYADPFLELGVASTRRGAAWEVGLRFRRLSRFTIGGGGQFGLLWGVHW